MNKKVSFKIIITIVLFSFATLKLNLSEMMGIFVNINIPLLILCLFVVPLLYLIRTLKWNALLLSVGIKHPFLTVFRVLLIGMFYGMVTPGKSGEILRAYYIGSENTKIIPTIIWDKIIDIFVLLIFSMLSILFLFDNANLYTIAFLLFTTFIVITCVFLNKKIINFLLNFIGINDISTELFISTTHLIKNDIGLLLKLVILSISYYIIAIFLAVLVLKSLYADGNLYLAFTLPIIVLMGNIPITISGLGLREYITIICFEILGENPTIGFSFSIILFLLITLIPGLVGYVFMLKDRK